MALLVTIMVIVILYIFGAYTEHRERKQKEQIKLRFSSLTGNYIHKKTVTGTIIRVEYRSKDKLYFRNATEEELRFLKLIK